MLNQTNPISRQLRAARIIFNEESSVFDCIVRRMSDDAALLQLGSTFAVPHEFVLELKPFKERFQCTVTRRTPDAIEVAFARKG